jgi:hypothetical protein
MMQVAWSLAVAEGADAHGKGVMSQQPCLSFRLFPLQPFP